MRYVKSVFALALSSARHGPRLMDGLTKKYGKELKEMVEKLKPCPYCNTQHFVEFLLLQILRSATVEAVKKKEFSETVKRV
jgi:hypothetical protein